MGTGLEMGSGFQFTLQEGIAMLEGVGTFFEKNSLLILCCAVGIFLLICLVVKIVRKKLRKKLAESYFTSKFLISLFGAITETPASLRMIFAALVGGNILSFEGARNGRIQIFLLLLCILFIINVLNRYATHFVDSVLKNNVSSKNNLTVLVRVVIWIVGIFVFFANIGINLTPLVAGFGVAGIAVGFALQNLLGDLFSSFSILITKPFIVGDFIKVGESSTERVGTVTLITLKSTTLLNTKGQEVIIPNSNILNTEVINYGKMKHRRERLKLEIQYGTSAKKLKLIPQLVEKCVNEATGVQYEWCYLEKVTEYGFQFLVSYDIQNPDYRESLIVNEKILVHLVEAFEAEDIKFSLPSRVMYQE